MNTQVCMCLHTHQQNPENIRKLINTEKHSSLNIAENI